MYEGLKITGFCISYVFGFHSLNYLMKNVTSNHMGIFDTSKLNEV